MFSKVSTEEENKAWETLLTNLVGYSVMMPTESDDIEKIKTNDSDAQKTTLVSKR